MKSDLDSGRSPSERITRTESTIETLPVKTQPSPNRARKRRFSISSEATTVTASPVRVEPKHDAETVEMLKKMVSKEFLFQSLSHEQLEQVVHSLEKSEIEEGTEIITEGADGDFFYVIEKGDLQVYKDQPDKSRKLVYTYRGNGCFGELALLYNCPRAASIVASTAATLWKMDRSTFRAVVISSRAAVVAEIDYLLSSVPLLEGASVDQRSAMSDIMSIQTFTKNEYIIKQNEKSDKFYILSSGSCAVVQSFDDGEKQQEHKLASIGRFEYFGELGLIREGNRTASVIVDSAEPAKVICVEGVHFDHLFRDQFAEEFKSKAESYVKASPTHPVWKAEA